MDTNLHDSFKNPLLFCSRSCKIRYSIIWLWPLTHSVRIKGAILDLALSYLFDLPYSAVETFKPDCFHRSYLFHFRLLRLLMVVSVSIDYKSWFLPPILYRIISLELAYLELSELRQFYPMGGLSSPAQKVKADSLRLSAWCEWKLRAGLALQAIWLSDTRYLYSCEYVLRIIQKNNFPIGCPNCVPFANSQF